MQKIAILEYLHSAQAHNFWGARGEWLAKVSMKFPCNLCKGSDGMALRYASQETCSRQFIHCRDVSRSFLRSLSRIFVPIEIWWRPHWIILDLIALHCFTGLFTFWLSFDSPKEAVRRNGGDALQYATEDFGCLKSLEHLKWNSGNPSRNFHAFL